MGIWLTWNNHIYLHKPIFPGYWDGISDDLEVWKNMITWLPLYKHDMRGMEAWCGYLKEQIKETIEIDYL